MICSDRRMALEELPYYWPGIGRREAEELLNKPDCDTFLVRDSTTYRYSQCLSFKQEGHVFHCIIPDSEVGPHTLNGTEGWHKSVKEVLQGWPTTIRPLYRCRTLQELCRSVIWRCNAVGLKGLPQHLMWFLHPQYHMNAMQT